MIEEVQGTSEDEQVKHTLSLTDGSYL